MMWHICNFFCFVDCHVELYFHEEGDAEYDSVMVAPSCYDVRSECSASTCCPNVCLPLILILTIMTSTLANSAPSSREAVVLLCPICGSHCGGILNIKKIIFCRILHLKLRTTSVFSL